MKLQPPCAGFDSGQSLSERLDMTAMMHVQRIVRWLALALFWLAAGLAYADTAKPLKGVALVIGEAKYEHLPALANPGNDAAAMAKALTDLGFEVTQVSDLNLKKLKRTLANFADDAEGADAAVVYYSGHGIEAGGENWLIPTDADVAALDDAAKTLVPLSPLLDRVKESVPVTLMFLDACRSNPFPPGSVLKAGGSAAPVAAAGLATGKGVVSVDAGSSEQGIGMVIGFAAEPGHAALDGPKGGNSPYAAALLRHLAAMNGEEFGTVMRLVTEEVYLKTQGQQRPWVNETLTRLLYFGGKAEQLSGDDGRILGERRKLLLAIASLPDLQRVEVEQAARSEGVPMDALYGFLRSIGVQAPSDPKQLSQLLDAQAQRLRAVLTEQQTLASPDAEIQRLSGLAQQALREGALESSIAFWERAKARYAEISKSLDETEAQLKARRLEGGAVFAHAAEARALAADYRAAADDYAQAYAQVAKWDAHAAWDYKSREADAWFSDGQLTGDLAALDRSVAGFAAALALAPRETAPLDWALTQNNLGNAYLLRAQQSLANDQFDKALAAYRAALEVRTRAAYPQLWARTQNNIALVSVDLFERNGDKQLLDQAIAAYRAALTETPRHEQPVFWSMIMGNLGNALVLAGPPQLEEAVAAQRAALQERPREKFPLDWADGQGNLANALSSLGEARGDIRLIDEAVAAYRASLDEVRRDRAPAAWAKIQYNVGTALNKRAAISSRAEDYKEAAAALRLALQARSFETSPIEWAQTQYNLANALSGAGRLSGDAELLRQAAAAYTQSLRVYSRERGANDWATTRFFLAAVQSDLGWLTEDAEMLTAAAASDREVIELRTPGTADWADANYDLGKALYRLGQIKSDAVATKGAVEAYRQSLTFYSRERNAKDWADKQLPLAKALSQLGSLTRDESAFDEAIAAFGGVLQVYATAAPEQLRKARQSLADAQYNYGLVLRRSGLDKRDAARERRSVAAFRAALAFYTRARNEKDWADTELQLADALNDQAILTAERPARDEAIVRYRAALQVLSAQATPELWEQAKSGLSVALYGSGIESRSAAALNEGRALAAELSEYYAGHGNPEAAARMRDRIKLFDAAIAKLPPR